MNYELIYNLLNTAIQNEVVYDKHTKQLLVSQIWKANYTAEQTNCLVEMLECC